MRGRWCLVVVFAVPATAFAHHVVSEYGIAPAEPVSVVELEAQAASFDLHGRRGSWQVAAARIEYPFLEKLSATVRVPTARVAERGDVAMGLGDVSVAGKVLLYASPGGRLLASAGFGVELPTGDPNTGLGSGHVEVSPFVAVAATWEKLAAFAFGAGRFAASGSSGQTSGAAHLHGGSLLDPHSDTEADFEAGLAYVFAPVYVAATAEVALDLADTGHWGTAFAGAQVGARLGDKIRLMLAADVPVAGEHRREWRATLLAGVDFDGRVHAAAEDYDGPAR